MNHHQVRDFPGRKRPNLIQLAKKFRAVRRGNMDGFKRREAGFNQQLDFAEIAGILGATEGAVKRTSPSLTAALP